MDRYGSALPHLDIFEDVYFTLEHTMTPHQIVGVAARLFAVWLFITALQAIGTGITTNVRPGTEATIVPYVFSALFTVIALLLWFFPMAVAHRLVPKTKYENVLSVTAHEAVVVATVILGLWLLVARAIPAISFYTSVAVYWSRNGQLVSSLDSSLHAQFVVGLVDLVVGLALVLKAPDISAFIVRKQKGASEE